MYEAFGRTASSPEGASQRSSVPTVVCCTRDERVSLILVATNSDESEGSTAKVAGGRLKEETGEGSWRDVDDSRLLGVTRVLADNGSVGPRPGSDGETELEVGDWVKSDDVVGIIGGFSP